MAKEKWNHPKVKEAFENITDTFTGADGGVRFWAMLKLVEGLDDLNDDASKIILAEVIKFSRLINSAYKWSNKSDKGQ